MTAAPASRGLVIDLQALQSETTRGRGIGRFAAGFALALETRHPDLVVRYLLSAELPPPAVLEELAATGKLAYHEDDDAYDDAAALHLLSPLDTALPVASLVPRRAGGRGLAVGVTVYDLIPALDEATHLVDPLERRRYRTHLELVRGADQLHVLSRAVGADLVALLGVASADVVEVGAAPDLDFRPPTERSATSAHARQLLGRHGLQRPYVLYPSGSHPRKNNEQLVRAWALLAPEVRASYQLVITGEVPESTAHHYRHLAATLGAETPVVPGVVDASTFVTLIQGADLVCVPSLAEGYGLPIVEALACATPVICSDRPPFDELVEDAGRFDPERAEAIAASIGRALSDAELRRRLAVGRPGVPATWADVADRAAAGFARLLTAGRRPHSGRRRLAVVTPLPPAPTGVATYSARLLTELARRRVAEIDVFADGPTPGQVAPAGLPTFSAPSLPLVEALRGGYDEVLYTFGNSHHHLGALELLRRRPGVVLSHDVRLSNLYRHAHGDPGFAPGGFRRALMAMYGPTLPPEIGADGGLTATDTERFGLFMAREVARGARRMVVTSQTAAALARVDAGDVPDARIGVLPFAVVAPDTDTLSPDDRSSALVEPPGAPVGPVLAHFGIVDPIKAPELLVDTLGELHRRAVPATLAFVGPIASDLEADLVARAETLGVAGALVIAGALDPDRYRAWFGRASVAVQLRRATNGEASAAVGECLASGIATVVSRLGWLRELPDDTVVKVPVDVDASALADVLEGLLADEGRRAALGAEGRAYAAGSGFAAVVDALLGELGFAGESALRR